MPAGIRHGGTTLPETQASTPERFDRVALPLDGDVRKPLRRLDLPYGLGVRVTP